MKTPYFPHFHGPHIIFSVTHYHSHYKKNPDDNDLCHTRLYHLTTAVHEKQITAIGLAQTLNRFTAQKANQFSIKNYDQDIA